MKNMIEDRRLPVRGPVGLARRQALKPRCRRHRPSPRHDLGAAAIFREREAWMATVTIENFRCMMCGHEYEEKVEKGEDKERSCPKCRSNSIRHLKKKKKAPVN